MMLKLRENDWKWLLFCHNLLIMTKRMENACSKPKVIWSIFWNNMNVSLLNKLWINKEALWLPVNQATKKSPDCHCLAHFVFYLPLTSFAGNYPPTGVIPGTFCFMQVATRWLWAAPTGTQGFLITIKDDIKMKEH